MNLPTLQFHSTDRIAGLHTREQLNEFLTSSVSRPEVLTDAAYKKLSADKRAAYDRARTLYISGGVMLTTPHVVKARSMLLQSFAENAGRNSGHGGLILDGDSTVGKTTTTKALMRYVHDQYTRQFPGYDPGSTVPIVYVEVPPASTAKELMKTFASYFGLTVRNAESMVDIRSRVIDVINAAGTQLIVVDELHNLAGRSVARGESVDVLKSLHNELPCTFLYAGINLGAGELLSGARGQQMSGRFNMLRMKRYNLSRAEDKKIWRGLVAGFEQKLPLHHQEPGTLVAQRDYLFERTSGSIGSLAKLLSAAAHQVLGTPAETLDKALFETITLDNAAEQARASAARKRSKARAVEEMLAEVVAA